MPEIIYDGSLGPVKIRAAGILFTASEAVEVGQPLADLLLKKSAFKPANPKRKAPVIDKE